MTFSEHKPAFDRDGFVIVRQFLPPAELADLNRNLDRYIREVVPTLPDARPSTSITPGRKPSSKCTTWPATPTSATMSATRPGTDSHNPARGGRRANEPEWFNKPPGPNTPTPPHQDNYYFCLKPPSVLTIWLALDPVDTENGACATSPARTGTAFARMADPASSAFRRASPTTDRTTRRGKCRSTCNRATPSSTTAETIHRAEPTVPRRATGGLRPGLSGRRAAGATRRSSSLPGRSGGPTREPGAENMTQSPPLERTDLDRRIWEEELDDFVPRNVFDAHTHVYRWVFDLNPDKRRARYRPSSNRALPRPPWTSSTPATLC